MKKTLKVCFLLAATILISSFTLARAAEDPAPLAKLKRVATQMTNELDLYQGRLKNNDALINSIVNRILLPHFDLNNMSRAVVGRDAWQSASASLQKEFISEFTRYVIRTYSSALASYSGEKIKFFPMRAFDPNQTMAQINSNIIQKDGPPIAVSYRLKQQDGDWVIYDFSVEGVSLVQNYRSQFAGTLQQGGLALLVNKLKSHNRGLQK